MLVWRKNYIENDDPFNDEPNIYRIWFVVEWIIGLSKKHDN